MSKLVRIYDKLYNEIIATKKTISDKIGIEISFEKASKIYFEAQKGNTVQLTQTGKKTDIKLR